MISTAPTVRVRLPRSMLSSSSPPPPQPSNDERVAADSDAESATNSDAINSPSTPRRERGHGLGAALGIVMTVLLAVAGVVEVGRMKVMVPLSADVSNIAGADAWKARTRLCQSDETVSVRVVPHVRAEGVYRLQRWVQQHNTPWRATAFAQPYFDRLTAEQQLLAPLPLERIQVLGPEWTCAPVYVQLHTMQCTWNPCRRTAYAAAELPPLPQRAAAKHQAVHHLRRALEGDAMVHAMEPVSSGGSRTRKLAMALRRAFRSSSSSGGGVLLRVHFQGRVAHAAQQTARAGEVVWNVTVDGGDAGLWGMQDVWEGVVVATQQLRVRLDAIVWPVADFWWTDATTPAQLHAFSVVQRLAAIGVTQVAAGTFHADTTVAPMGSLRPFGVMAVLELLELPPSAPLQRRHPNTTVTAVVPPPPTAVGASVGASVGDNNALDAWIITRARLDVFWVRSLVPFLDRLRALQRAMRTAPATRREGLGVAVGQFYLAELFCTNCVTQRVHGTAMWDTMRLDSTTEFMTSMQCGA